MVRPGEFVGYDCRDMCLLNFGEKRAKGWGRTELRSSRKDERSLWRDRHRGIHRWGHSVASIDSSGEARDERSEMGHLILHGHAWGSRI